MTNKYQKALNLFNQKNYDAAFVLFDELNQDYECGYCKLAQGKIKEAQIIWEATKTDSPAIEWGLVFIKLMQAIVPPPVTFFQIRNFLERDLTLLFENNLLRYAENVIAATKILTEYNPETPKFIGRVLLNNGFYQQAFEFLLKARNICYSDPEVHYLLARYYLFIDDSDSAAKILQSSIQLNPAYFPAKHLLDFIQNGCIKE